MIMHREIRAALLGAAALAVWAGCMGDELAHGATRPEALTFEAAGLYEHVFPQQKRGAPVETVSTVAAQGEIKAATFVVRAARNLSNLSVSVADLVGPGGSRIPSARVDIRVVKIWQQMTKYSEDPGKPVQKAMVPELLLKDDRVEFRERWEGDTYIAPTLGTTFGTALRAGEGKQIWLTIHVPESAQPGEYLSVLTFTGDGGGGTLQLRIGVLPFTLPSPEKQFVIYYRGSVNPREVRYVPEAQYRMQLADIRSHGFQGIVIDEDTPEDVLEAASRAKAAGLVGPLVIMGAPKTAQPEPYAQLSRRLMSLGMPVYFYGLDEPNNPEKIQQHIRRSKAAHAAGQRVVTAIRRPWAEALTKPGGEYQEPLEWVNYPTPVEETWGYFASARRGASSRIGRVETYYWQCYMEQPAMNRVFAGFGLVASGADGVAPFTYLAFHKTLPYATDERSLPPRKRMYKVYAMAYPAADGPVPTLQWEAMREGIDDTRYITVAKQLVARLRSAGRRAEAERLETGVRGVVAPFERINSEADAANTPPALLEAARAKLLEHISAGLKALP